MENLTALFSSQTSVIILFLISFIGGLLASVSPCSLSMLPLIIGYVGGYSNARPYKTFIQMLAFVFGSSIVFAIIGIICALTGKIFIGNPYFMLIIASVILIMGLNIIQVIDIQLPVLIKEIPQNNTNSEFLYPMLLGAVFAIIGTPCSTPILASIMGFASISANIGQSVIMLFLFSLGQGLILIFAGVLTSKIKTNPKFYDFSEKIMKICGVLLILASAYIFYKIFSSGLN